MDLREFVMHAPETTDIDSLLFLINNHNKEGVSARMGNDVKEAEDHYKYAYSTAVGNQEVLKSNNHSLAWYESEFCTNIGDLRRMVKSIDEALDFFGHAIDVLEGDDSLQANERKAKAYELRSLVYRQLRKDPDKELSDVENAARLYKDVGNNAKSARLSLFHALAMVSRGGDLDAAVEECNTAIEAYERMLENPEPDKVKDLTHNLGDSYHTLGVVQAEHGNYDDALKSYTRGFEEFDKIGDIGSKGVVNARMAYSFMKLGKTQSAEQNYDAFVKIRDMKPCPIQDAALEFISKEVSVVEAYLGKNHIDFSK